MKKMLFASVLLGLAPMLIARQPAPVISGDYLEARTSHVYTGHCVANGEMGLTGKEGILVWKVRDGQWNGTSLNGLSVIVVIQAGQSLMDVEYQNISGRAVLIVDAKASPGQQAALEAFARSMAGHLISEVVAVQTSDLEVSLAACANSSCATVKAEGLVNISTQCMSGKTHLCGNEQVYYPPLTPLDSSHVAYTEVASYTGNALAVRWESRSIPSAFIGQFSR